MRAPEPCELCLMLASCVQPWIVTVESARCGGDACARSLASFVRGPRFVASLGSAGWSFQARSLGASSPRQACFPLVGGDGLNSPGGHVQLLDWLSRGNI